MACDCPPVLCPLVFEAHALAPQPPAKCHKGTSHFAWTSDDAAETVKPKAWLHTYHRRREQPRCSQPRFGEPT